MLAQIEPLQAREVLVMAQTVRLASAAGATVASWSKNIVEYALDDYNRFVTGLEARVLGTVGEDVDEHGRTVLRTTKQIRAWFAQGGFRV